MKVVKLESRKRETRGTSAARRARREGRLPAVIYAEGAPATHIDLDLREFRTAVEKGARVIDLMEDGNASRVLLKDLQYDALGRKLVHADFLHVRADKELTLRIPVRLRGVPRGVLRGGVLAVQSQSIDISCLPKDIPEHLEVDVSGMRLGATLKAGELAMPERVVMSADPDTVIASIVIPRGVSADDDADPASAEGEAQAEGEAAAEGEESTEA